MRAATTKKIVALAIGSALLVGACGSSPADDPAAESATITDPARATDPAVSRATSPGNESDAPVESGVLVAVTDGDLTIYSDTAGTVHTVLPAHTDFGSTRALLVAADHGD